MVYRVEPHIRGAFWALQPFFELENQARTLERPLIGDAVSSIHPVGSVASSLIGKMLAGKERKTREQAVKFAEWLTGRDIIGCGAEALVTRSGSQVIKFAVDPHYRPDIAVTELSRRHKIASRYLGDFLLPTEFHLGSRDGSVPDSVVMTQDFEDIVGDVHFDAVDADLVGDFKDRSLALARDWGILVDVCPGRGNLAIVQDNSVRKLRLIDGSLVLRDEDGQPMPLARRFIVDADKVEADIRYLPVAA